MDIEQIREHCLSYKGVTEGLPFGPDVLVFKVMGKMFCLMSLNTEDLRISLKNTPEKNIELRAEHPFISGAYHMNKTHWNSVDIKAYVRDTLLKELIEASYDLIVEGLPKKVKEELNTL